ncbi:MAG TPA: ATP-binding protein, partial [Tepidisphaeraceae bacterium]|nr:ATP-binding protein [Tepidisphaeraceae bacterium]
MLTLLVLQGPDKGRRYELPDAPAQMGRESRQIPITDNTVSRRHCQLEPEDGHWILKDMGSSNGTYVNGLKVQGQQELRLGDQIRIGQTLMVFGAQPGMHSASSSQVALAGQDAMDSSIIHAIPASDDSLVLAAPDPMAAAVANLKLLYQLGASLGSAFDIEHVLEVIMDLVFEHVKADRGMILLTDENGQLVPRIARVRDELEKRKKDAPQPPTKNGEQKIHASRTIIQYVMEKDEGVLSSNAMSDQRFSKGKSVHNLGIRSALCAPIRARRLDGKDGDEIIGVIYIDSSVRNYTYSMDQLRLLTAIGSQAGLAIQNAKLYRQGLQAERLAAVGETTAALSHSIKNILQALHGGADVVEMGFRGNNMNQAQKGWRIVDRNLNKIYSLTTNLLAYSRPREPKLEMVHIKSIIDDCRELVAGQANEKGVMVVADVDPDMPPMALDADGVHQVIVNLLSNALDAVAERGGLVRVLARFEPEPRQAVIEVIDNGSGVPASMMSHMFELFHSTKGNRGTGLGLAVAKKIVEEHEGSISVKSQQGEGTTFTVRLPSRKAGDPSQTYGPG